MAESAFKNVVMFGVAGLASLSILLTANLGFAQETSATTESAGEAASDEITSSAAEIRMARSTHERMIEYHEGKVREHLEALAALPADPDATTESVGMSMPIQFEPPLSAPIMITEPPAGSGRRSSESRAGSGRSASKPAGTKPTPKTAPRQTRSFQDVSPLQFGNEPTQP